MPTMGSCFSIYQRRYTGYTICLLRVFILKYVRGKGNHLLADKILVVNYLKEIDKSFCSSSSKYDNFIFLGDHSTEPTKSAIKEF